MKKLGLRDQQRIWEEEHFKQKTFAKIHTDLPSKPVLEFTKFLKKQYPRQIIRVVDIGCGKGRNSRYLASQDFKVVGADFSNEAVKSAKKKGSLKNLKYMVMDLTKPWSFKNESLEAIVDCNATICLPSPGRTKALQESYRALKTGGYYLFYGVGAAGYDEKQPGPEPNSSLFPDGMFEKHYTKEELLETYQDLNFGLVSLDKVEDKTLIEGREKTIPLWVSVFQK